MKHLYLITFCLFLFVGNNLKAQDGGYQHAIGIRAGSLAGVSYKRFLSFPSAIEGIIGFNYANGRLLTATGLYEYHIFINYDLNFFVGGGLTLGANKDEVRLIAEALGGIEYSLPNFPLSFSLDYKPAYSIFGNEIFLNEYALTVRYTL